MNGDLIIIYLGVIDILQSYRLKKKIEHTMKAFITDGVCVCVCVFLRDCWGKKHKWLRVVAGDLSIAI